MSKIEKINRYIERTKFKDEKGNYGFHSGDIAALFSEVGGAYALMLAFDYGRAKGYGAAKAEASRQRG